MIVDLAAKPAILISLLGVMLICANGESVCASDYRAADVQAAVKELSSVDEGARHSAAFHLSEMGPEAKDAIPRLIEILKLDPNMGVRGQAAQALGKIGTAAGAAVPALISFLQSEQGGYERTYAASALGDVDQQPELAVPALIEALKHDQEPVVRHMAAQALGSFGKDAKSAIPSLIEGIDQGDKEMRQYATYGLRQIPAGIDDVPSLVKLLSDDVDVAREAAARSLAGAGSDATGAVPQLIKLLDDKNSSVKEAAVIALGAVGPGAKEAVPFLKKALLDSQVHNEAEQALNKIKRRH